MAFDRTKWTVLLVLVFTVRFFPHFSHDVAVPVIRWSSYFSRPPPPFPETVQLLRTLGVGHFRLSLSLSYNLRPRLHPASGLFRKDVLSAHAFSVSSLVRRALSLSGVFKGPREWLHSGTSFQFPFAVSTFFLLVLIVSCS